jgi:hypothetical protein
MASRERRCGREYIGEARKWVGIAQTMFRLKVQKIAQAVE